MLLEIIGAALILGVSYVVGTGLLAALDAHHLRRGDRFILASWLGLVVLSVALLATSLVVPLSATAGAVCGAVVAGAGVWLSRRFRRGERSPETTPSARTATAVGVALITLGASALASDPVTLYDSLVYHVGAIRWLHEHGTVVGIALLHNRFGHVSSWFALAAPFDGGVAASRATNVPLAAALVLVGLQGAIVAARITARRASESDWFMALASAALIWPVARYGVASPSPDVPTAALVVAVAWSMLVVPRSGSSIAGDVATWRNPRLTPYLLAIGAMTMKLFALPAAIAGAMFFALAAHRDGGARHVGSRVIGCAVVGLVLLAPFIAASLIASGCPLFPAPVGCLDMPFSVGAAKAADYAEYVRDFARWETRQDVAVATPFGWIRPWSASHPWLVTLGVAAPALAVAYLRGPRRDGESSVLLLALLGIAFAAWQAPAPRFLYAFLIIVPALAIAGRLSAWSQRGGSAAPESEGSARRAALGFVGYALFAGAGYAVTSQKLNIGSAMATGASPFVANRSALLLPSPPALGQLYSRRINDVDVVTPVPPPILDTLGYRSAIDGNLGFESCSTAPLPCTPYLPPRDFRLRVPSRGLAGGFTR